MECTGWSVLDRMYRVYFMECTGWSVLGGVYWMECTGWGVVYWIEWNLFMKFICWSKLHKVVVLFVT